MLYRSRLKLIENIWNPNKGMLDDHWIVEILPRLPEDASACYKVDI